MRNIDKVVQNALKFFIDKFRIMFIDALKYWKISAFHNTLIVTNCV